MDGDAFTTNDNLIFYTFGYEHPPHRVHAFLKYVPTKLKSHFQIRFLPKHWKLGDIELIRPETLYSASNLQELITTFQRSFPQYLYFSPFHEREIVSSPRNLIREVYVPSNCLQKLSKTKKRDQLQTSALELTTLLSTQSGVSLEDFGLHGSIALNMHNAGSDIDLVVYGSENFRKVEETVGCMAKEGELNYVFKDKLDRLRKQRGQYKDKIFVYNAVRKPKEVTVKYGDHQYSPVRPVMFSCKILDDSQTMFRPAIYPINDYQALNSTSKLGRDEVPTVVVSMIGCYRNVARKDDKVHVSGVLERVEHTETGKVHCQAVVGSGTREDEYICPKARS